MPDDDGLIQLRTHVGHIPAATVRLIAHIRTLTWLSVADCHVTSLAALMDEDGAVALPALKHLDMSVCSAAKEWQ